MKKTILTIFVLVTIWMMDNWRSDGLYAVDDSEIKKPPVKVLSASRRDVSTTISSLGTLNFLNKAEVNSEINGMLRSVDVDIGDRVQKGQVVAAIDTSLLEAQLNEARALLELEEFTLPQWQNEVKKLELRVDKNRLAMQNYADLFESQQKLAETGSISRARLNLAEIDYQTALLEYRTALADLKLLKTKSKHGRVEVEARIAKARTELQSIQTRIDKCLIRAPISGIVAGKRKWTGEKTSPNDSVLITILQTGEVYADVELNERNLARVRTGQLAEVRADAYPGLEFSGKVQVISPTIDMKSRTVLVRVKVLNQEQLLKPGMFARVNIILDTIPDALVIPPEAVIRTKDGRHMVFVIVDNVAFLREVQTGLQKDNLVVIHKGIKKGEKVVIEGKEQLKDLVSVQIVEDATR